MDTRSRITFSTLNLGLALMVANCGGDALSEPTDNANESAVEPVATESMSVNPDDPSMLGEEVAAPSGDDVLTPDELAAEDAPYGISTGHGIAYHGGSVMNKQHHIYYIFYGNWLSGGSFQGLLEYFASHVGGSKWFNINHTYGAALGDVPNTASYAGRSYDHYSHGKTLSTAAVSAIVERAIVQGPLPADSEGIYFVIPTADIKTSFGGCSSICGYHWWRTVDSRLIKYAYIVNNGSCPKNSCAVSQNLVHSPNGIPHADAMINIIGHELAEAVTDPEGQAWHNANMRENADLCAWKFGNYFKVNGGIANMKLGGKPYLIQELWVNAGSGFCALFH